MKNVPQAFLVRESELSQPAVRAFLKLISVAEGTANSPDPYRVCFGKRHTIQSLEDHPAITGEWKGERLADYLCEGAGFKPGCKSTAAGAYQFIRPTWRGLKKALGLPDFSPHSQDLAAWELIRRCGAGELVQLGLVAEALFKCRKQWASLPGAGYRQREHKLARLTEVFRVLLAAEEKRT